MRNAPLAVILAFAAIPLSAAAERLPATSPAPSAPARTFNQYPPYGMGSGSCNAYYGSAPSCVAGRISRIDGVLVYVDSYDRGSLVVNDQPLWDNGRQDRRLQSGQYVSFGGYFTGDGTFVATNITAVGGPGGTYGGAYPPEQGPIVGTIRSINGTRVELLLDNGERRTVNDQPLWDNGRQDRLLSVGQRLQVYGFYNGDGMFWITRLGATLQRYWRR